MWVSGRHALFSRHFCLLTLASAQLIDGNLAETLFEHGPGSAGGEPAVLVGVDQHGNKYFEKPGAQWGEARLRGIALRCSLSPGRSGANCCKRQHAGNCAYQSSAQRLLFSAQVAQAQPVLLPYYSLPMPRLPSCTVRNRFVVYAKSNHWRTQVRCCCCDCLQECAAVVPGTPMGPPCCHPATCLPVFLPPRHPPCCRPATSILLSRTPPPCRLSGTPGCTTSPMRTRST